jgi:hypothetical protein
MTNLKPFLVHFVALASIMYTPSTVPARPSSQDNSASRPTAGGTSTPTSYKGSEVYDHWKGAYDGACDYAHDGKLQRNVPFRLHVREPLGDGELGFVGGFDTDLKKTVTSVRFEIHLPGDPEKADSLRLSGSALSIEHTQRCPYKAEIAKTTDTSGKTMLYGSIVGYQIGPGGALSYAVVMDIRSFRVMR